MRFKPFFFIVFLILLVACTPGVNPLTSQIEPTANAWTPTPTNTSYSQAPADAPTQTAEEAGLHTQCLDIATKAPGDLQSSGIVILDRVDSGGPYKGNTLLLDMATGTTTQFNREREGQIDHIVSPNKNRMAYESIIFNSKGGKIKDELIITDATGNQLNSIPWEKEWLTMVTWLDNERLIISLLLTPEENSGEKPLTMLILNPFTNERRILKPDLPGLSDAPSTTFLSLDGWSGVVYDPTVTFAVYPYLIKKNEAMYTYVIWDLSKQKLVTSLEDIFTASSYDPYPIPRWSPEGSQFVFEGIIRTSDSIKFELYRVKPSGQTEQLTHLSPIAHMQDSSFSWSPDGRYIAMFLNAWGVYEPDARVALLDTETLQVTDYCISVIYSGKGYGRGAPPPPVWSPDSKQFLVVDWYEKDHQRLILIDIEGNIAVEIPENMEPMGWMATP